MPWSCQKSSHQSIEKAHINLVSSDLVSLCVLCMVEVEGGED